MKFSANLGFLWQELSLPDAIRAAADAGFDAVEVHWPYETPSEQLVDVLEQTRLPLLGLNTIRGDVERGENGLCALPGREADAIASIDSALAYANAAGAEKIHVMAGFAEGIAAHETFVANLTHACDMAAATGKTILIEPLNHHDAPGYFLQTSQQARAIIEAVARDNLKLMFDCYHLQIMEGDISRRLRDLMPLIGHIQIASVPDRAEPDHGELSYGHVFGVLEELGYSAPIGAEYKPRTDTEAGLGWMKAF